MRDKNTETNVCKMPPNDILQSRYQFYKPVPDILRMKVTVNESINIPNSSNHYAVKLKIPDKLFDGNGEKQTSRMAALHSPKWNETLAFLVKKKDLDKHHQLKIDFSLLGEDFSNVPKSKTVQVTMDDILENGCVKFKNNTATNHGIEVKVTAEFEGDTDVKFRDVDQLCEEEQLFVHKRRKIVFENLKDKLGLTKLARNKDVPNIAIIGSGGGIRAVIGMCGAMTSLQDQNILDCAMYTAGLSGSAWYLMSLYAFDSHLKPKAFSDSLRQKVQHFQRTQFWKAWYSWKSYYRGKAFYTGEYFTVTDTFGEMIGDLLLKKKCKGRWSDQRKKLETGSVPLPLVAALHVRDETTITHYNEWIEFSPYEMLIPRYGAAIDMKNFGDRFYGGFLTKRYGEQPIHFLQGVVGSGYAIVKNLNPEGNVWYQKFSIFKDQIFSFFYRFDNAFVGKVPNVLHGISQFQDIVEGLDETEDNIFDTKTEDMMLVDAGIAFSSPYPTVLHPARKVDIILSFDFSDRGLDTSWPFEELEKAEKWAISRNVPFPKLDLDKIRKKWEKKEYEEVYVFESDNAPTIVHFVMINHTFKDNNYRKEQHSQDSEQPGSNNTFRILPDYSTLKFSYSEQEFDKLKSLVEYNVFNNKEKIVNCIRTVIKRKSET